MSKRQQIIDQLAARLGTIQAGQQVALETGEDYTYQTSLGNNVGEWRESQFAGNEAEGIVFRDTTGEMPPSDETNSQDHELVIEISAGSGKKYAPSRARLWAEDILAALGQDPTFGGLALDAVPGTVELRHEEQGRELQGLVIDITIRYITTLWRI